MHPSAYEMFANRLRKMHRHFGRWARRQGIEAYRLYDRDIPQFPFVVEIYGPDAVIWEYEKRIAGVDDPVEWRKQAQQTIADSLQLSPEQQFYKFRRRGKQPYTKIGTEQVIRNIAEGGLQFEVNLADYVDTGLFLDHRITRGMVRAEAQNKKALNLFAYTGSFSVYAAAGGALLVDSVDLSEHYLERARRNMVNNGFADERFRYLPMDILQSLETLPGKFYDLIILDPPTFSTSKKMLRDFDIQRDAVALLKRCATLLRPGGKIYFSTNFRRFKMHSEELPEMQIQDYTARTIPPDFRDRRVHRLFLVQLAK